MTEYIYSTDGHEGHWLTGEEIVRCRDCEHRVAFEQPLNLERVYCDLRYSLYAVEDEGFCAWGERKAER